jgi:molecular chaperone DnaK
MADAVAIGIDLGTSNSCVAVTRGRNVEVLPNAFGENITASVVHFQDDGSIVVGNAAKARIIHDPKHTVCSAKRLIGRFFFSEEVKKAQAVCSYRIVEGPNHSVRIQARDEQFSLPEVSAMVLREMKSIAEERIGQPVRQAVITVPAYFNDNQRQATRDAGRIAGLEVLRLLNEPTAAALAYGFGRGLNQRVAVYDFGGGTFDVSILEIGKDVFEVLSTCGDTYLGGDDLDDRLIDLLADEFVAREGINLRGDPYAFEKLKVAAETAKKTLSVDESVEVNIPDICLGSDGQPRSVQRTINAAEYNSLIMDLIQRTFKVCDEALQGANLIARDLDGVILVGGPTRLPMIRNAVREYFQQEPKQDVNPDEVVAMGAAIHAASLVAPTQQSSYLLDVTPLSLRIGVAGGLAEPVIERNTPVPIEQTRTFTTVQDNQERVKIRVYQGESRRAEENELLGQFEFSGFKKAPRGQVRIDVTFEINGDGIVNVTACDRESGQQASTEIMLSAGLSEEEIANILAQRRTDRVQTSKLPGEAPPARSAPRPEAKRAAAPVAPRPEAKPPAAMAPPSADDDLEVLPDDDDLEAVLVEVTGAPEAPPVPVAPAAAQPPAPRAPSPVAPARPASVAPPAPLAPPRPAAVAPPPPAPVAPPAPSPVAAARPAPAPAAPLRAPAPAPIPVAAPEGPDLLSSPADELAGDLGDDLVGPLDVVADADLELEVAAPPSDFDGTLPASENEIELDPGDLEGLGDVDLGSAGDFATGVEGGPMIGGAEEFSEGDFAAPPAEEDPNAKTQPDLEAESGSAAPAPAAGEVDLFGEAGVDLSVFGDDGEEGR